MSPGEIIIEFRFTDLTGRFGEILMRFIYLFFNFLRDYANSTVKDGQNYQFNSRNTINDGEDDDHSVAVLDEPLSWTLLPTVLYHFPLFLLFLGFSDFLFCFCSNLRADNRVPSSSCQITRKNRSWALPVSLKVEKFQLQRGTRRRGSPCFVLSFENEGLVKNGIGDADGIIIVDHGSRRRESNLMLGNTSVSVPSPSSSSLYEFM